MRPRELAVAAVIVLLPFGGVSVPGVGMSLVYVAMAVPAVLAFRAVVKAEAQIPASVTLLGLGLGVVGGLLSFATGVDPGGAAPLVVMSLLTVSYAVGIALAYRPGLERAALDLVTLVGGVIAVMALVSVGSLAAAEGGWVISGRLTGPFAQPNELGMACAALLPIAVVCLVTAESRRLVGLLGVATCALVMAWALSMSRGAWIGGIAALVCLAICEPRTRRTLAGVGAALAATCVLALLAPRDTALLGVIGARLDSLGDPTQNQYDARPLIWAEAWRQATEHPWLGVGPGGFQPAAIDSVSAISSYDADHPHNLFLTILAERGVIGLSVGLLVVAGCVLATRRHVLADTSFDAVAGSLRSRSVAVVAGLVAVAVHCVFDMPLRNPIVSAVVWTLLGMAIVAETSGARREPLSAGSRTRGRPSSSPASQREMSPK